MTKKATLIFADTSNLHIKERPITDINLCYISMSVAVMNYTCIA